MMSNLIGFCHKTLSEGFKPEEAKSEDSKLSSTTVPDDSNNMANDVCKEKSAANKEHENIKRP